MVIYDKKQNQNLFNLYQNQFVIDDRTIQYLIKQYHLKPSILLFYHEEFLNILICIPSISMNYNINVLIFYIIFFLTLYYSNIFILVKVYFLLNVYKDNQL